MRVSIILPYYNRKELLRTSLQSFQKWYASDRHRLEIVIVDDGSAPDQQLDDLVAGFQVPLDILLVKLPPKQSLVEVNPCYPYNVGVRASSGDIIVLSSPETFHTASIFAMTNDFDRLENDTYLLFSVFCCTNQALTNEIVARDFEIGDRAPFFDGLGAKGRASFNNANGSWYVCSLQNSPLKKSLILFHRYLHSRYRETKLNFLSALTRQTYSAIGGFDERYRNGTGFDDNDFLERLSTKLRATYYYDEMFAIHVDHSVVHELPPTTNQELYLRLTALPISERYPQNTRWGMLGPNRALTIVVFGSKGMFGRYCVKYFELQGYRVIGYDRSDFDAAAPEKLSELVKTWPPGSFVINAIGVIPQKVGLSNAMPFIRINSVFPHVLSYACEQANCVLVHLTTDCIYNGSEQIHPNPLGTGYPALSGSSRSGYPEGARPTEDNIYGKSKAAGEPQNAMIIRTSIIGEELTAKRSLLEWVRSHQPGAEIVGYANHHWNGLTCLQVAKLIDECIRFGRVWKGVRHLVSPEPVTKKDLCSMINDVYQLGLTVAARHTQPPVNKTLAPSSDPIVRAIQFTIPPIRIQLQEMKEFLI